MTGSVLSLRAPTAADVPWDKARERRVLERALDSRRRRARRKCALELSLAMMATLLIGRVLPRASAGGDAPPTCAVPARELAPTPDRDPKMSLSGATKPVPKGSAGGFAGTGGHGGTGSAGFGGSAGTG